MNIQHKESEKEGSFFIEEDGVKLAELVYFKPDNKRIIIDHTEVSDVLRGQSVGKKLVEAAVIYARGKQMKIVPVCSYAKTVLERTEAYQDVLN